MLWHEDIGHNFLLMILNLGRNLSPHMERKVLWSYSDEVTRLGDPCRPRGQCHSWDESLAKNGCYALTEIGASCFMSPYVPITWLFPKKIKGPEVILQLLQLDREVKDKMCITQDDPFSLHSPCALSLRGTEILGRPLSPLLRCWGKDRTLCWCMASFSHPNCMRL